MRTALALLLSTVAASAHQAPTGWTFDKRCCGSGDCYPVETDAITERPDGYHITFTGEVIPYQSYKVLPSPDGKQYRCSTAGSVQGITYCIYVPEKSW
ncbi:MAG: hypothetical protein EOS65_02535 [Mesorhizobium sp.]|uniref:hypothetical protein n=1 Tax=Mesorhizobium sp. TaxID=1871066 RepID=UPI000FE77966|nr:hypothetical protein [Mesorhizobium sp.]RWF44272.1 MAG: hypothetical protein EOS65_02535 [Mesorhizobium sp.]